MVRLVMNLLDVSRSEDGALVPHVTEFDLSTLLAEVCKEMGRRVDDKDQRLTLAVAPGVGDLRGDRDLVRRIVENLIDNAYKYGPRHTTIAIEVLPATMDDGAEPAVEIRVRDEGEGRPGCPSPADLRKVRAGGRQRKTARRQQPRAGSGVLPPRRRGARRRDLGGGRQQAGAAVSAFGCPFRGCRFLQRARRRAVPKRSALIG